MGAKSFQDLVCWQLARELRRSVRTLIATPSLSKDFDLCNQLRRSTRSATGNIAEGFGCRTHAEFARFLDIAARSIKETEDRLIESVDNQLITQEQTALAQNLAKRASVAVSRLANYLRSKH
jgi:four helix bundle protein